MKLALIVPGGVDRSGVDRVIYCNLWLIERLAKRHEVHVFALRQEPDPADWDLLGARIHNIGTRTGRRMRLVRSFVAEHRLVPFDIVHAFFGPSGPSAALLGRMHGVPVLFQPSGAELVAFPDIGYGQRRTLRGRVALRVSLVGADAVAVQTAYMQQLAAKQRVGARRVPMGVALDRWPPVPPRKRDPSKRVHLLHVADIHPVKDHQTMLAAAEHLRDAGIDFQLDFAGYDTLNGAVQTSPAARRLGATVKWHGRLRHEQLRELVERADLLLHSSRHEAGPLVVLEAAVAGVPSVGTAVGHIAEWAPEASVAVPVGDAAALARATASLLADEPRRVAIAEAAQQRAIEIDADYTAEAFERIYTELRDTRAIGGAEEHEACTPPPRARLRG